MFHRRLDAKSLARGAGRKDLKTRVWCGRKGTTRYRHSTEKAIHILRFSLDRYFTSVDTANPDSGERGSARRTESGILLGPCDKTHETGPGFKRKKRARSRSFALAFAEQGTCCEAVTWKAANGRALLLSSRGTETGRSVVASSF